MNNIDDILERLQSAKQPALEHPAELTDRIMERLNSLDSEVATPSHRLLHLSAVQHRHPRGAGVPSHHKGRWKWRLHAKRSLQASSLPRLQENNSLYSNKI